MALITCPDCNKEVSQDAFKCPSCGKTLKKPKRSLGGKIIKWSFIIFNVLMLIWLITGMNAASDVYQTAASEAEKAGAAIGTGIGVFMIFVFWAIGDAILGILTLLTRPKAQ